jgi:hypothetical protein
MRHDGDITNDRTLRLTVPEAAEVLGISAEAVRQRIKRRTLTTEKDADGSVFVLLDGDITRHNADRTNDITGDLALMQAHLDSMNEQVSYLKAVIQVRDEELRRKDHLLAALTERLPELEPPRETRESPETASPGAEGEVPIEEERRSWWRVLLGFQ